MGGQASLATLLNNQPSAVTLDKSTLQPAGGSSQPVTLDKSTLTPVNPSAEYIRGRTLDNMTRAMSGQPLANPDDQAVAERARKDGFEAAATQAALTVGGELLLAPRAVAALSKIPAGRDPATGRILPWVVKTATEEGPSLARHGFDALKAAGEAHPLVKAAILQGLTALGAGQIAHALGWIGKAAEP